MSQTIEIRGRSFKVSNHHECGATVGKPSLKIRTFSLTGSNGAEYGAMEMLDKNDKRSGIFGIWKFTGKVARPFPSTYLKINEAGAVEVIY